MDELGVFVKFYEKTGILGTLALVVGVVILYFLKGIIDLVVQKVKSKINGDSPSTHPKRYVDVLTKEKVRNEAKMVKDARESFVLRMDTSIADSVSRLRATCVLKGVVFSHLLRLKMEENKRVGLYLLDSYKDHSERDAVGMAEIVVSSLHKALTDFERRAKEDGIPTEIITKFLAHNRITEDVTDAVAKRMCLVSLLETNTKKIASVVDVIATLTILNIVDYQETADSFNGRAQLLLQQTLDTMKKEGKMYEIFKDAERLGCTYVNGKVCTDCTGKKHE